MIDTAKIRVARKMRGLSQIELAKAAGVGITTVQRCEQKGVISLKVAEKICSALCIEIPLRIAATYDDSMWVKCSERMPERDGKYLVVYAHDDGMRFYEILNYVTKSDELFNKGWNKFGDMLNKITNWSIGMTAWMPIPEYKEIENGEE